MRSLQNRTRGIAGWLCSPSFLNQHQLACLVQSSERGTYTFAAGLKHQKRPFRPQQLLNVLECKPIREPQSGFTNCLNEVPVLLVELGRSDNRWSPEHLVSQRLDSSKVFSEGCLKGRKGLLILVPNKRTQSLVFEFGHLPICSINRLCVKAARQEFSGSFCSAAAAFLKAICNSWSSNKKGARHCAPLRAGFIQRIGDR